MRTEMTRESLDRPVAIIAADVANYGIFAGRDADLALNLLNALRRTLQRTVTQFGGTVFGVAGDSAMVLFHDLDRALDCALQLQQAVFKDNLTRPEDERMSLRLGLHYGAVVKDQQGYYGDTVNVAARLQSLADIGGVALSGSAYEHLSAGNEYGFEYRGAYALKHVHRQVQVYRVFAGPSDRGLVSIAESARRPFQEMLVTGLVTVLLASAITFGTLRYHTVKLEQASQAAIREAQAIDLAGRLKEAEMRLAAQQRLAATILASWEEVERQTQSERQTAERLLSLRQNAEARMVAERQRSEDLYHAWKEAEQSAQQEKARAEELLAQLEQANRVAAAQKQQMRDLLVTWEETEKKAAAARRRAATLLAAKQDAEARAKAEKQQSERLLRDWRAAESRMTKERELSAALLHDLRQNKADLSDERDFTSRLQIALQRAHEELEDLRGRLQRQQNYQLTAEVPLVAISAVPELPALAAADSQGLAGASAQSADSLRREIFSSLPPPPKPAAKPLRYDNSEAYRAPGQTTPRAKESLAAVSREADEARDDFTIEKARVEALIYKNEWAIAKHLRYLHHTRPVNKVENPRISRIVIANVNVLGAASDGFVVDLEYWIRTLPIRDGRRQNLVFIRFDGDALQSVNWARKDQVVAAEELLIRDGT